MALTSGTAKYSLAPDVIEKDLTIEAPQWILSAYAPGRDAPEQLFGGYPREQSFEELRLHYLVGKASGNEQQAVRISNTNKLFHDCSNQGVRSSTKHNNYTKMQSSKWKPRRETRWKRHDSLWKRKTGIPTDTIYAKREPKAHHLASLEWEEGPTLQIHLVRTLLLQIRSAGTLLLWRPRQAHLASRLL